MRTSGLVYVSPALQTVSENALNQVMNVACLPGIVGQALAMPDVHWGYGFPIGGVAAFDCDEGVISPGGVGYDINCGVGCLRSDLAAAELKPSLENLLAALFAAIPAGLGGSGLKLGSKDFAAVTREGAAWLVKQGRLADGDLNAFEDGGRLEGADQATLSERAAERGRSQLGTLGSGNHFIEIDAVETIYDQAAARAFGLESGQVVIQVHTGSRGFGYQVCDDYLHRMLKRSFGFELPDRQLVAAPLASAEGRAYRAAMTACANYAFVNRGLIYAAIREVFEAHCGCSWEQLGLRLIQDCCHNIAKFDKIGDRELCIHRKGATRALPPGDQRLPAAYRTVGQPVLVPGDLGRCSYILAASSGASASFFSACHGAGRSLSRHQAKAGARGRNLRAELAGQNIQVLCASQATLAEELPEAYKDVSQVVMTIEGAGLARRVARLGPLGVIKG